jgi:hypothetical protein
MLLRMQPALQSALLGPLATVRPCTAAGHTPLLFLRTCFPVLGTAVR